MKTVEIHEMAAVLEQYDETEQPLVLMRNGQPIAALLSLEEIDLTTLMEIDPELMGMVERSRQLQAATGKVCLKDILSPSET
ncbi:MAG: type II toxin-antitoxin system Phd/YefM family antitoxin [Oculatellaceae cyanobacterium Prado106]|jgi:PHD/YefM family antitoxin component YafN of YafNO toxin-antitoxin module|nr:type II toxin-antitoxin system Phd/YefM family antitoxin [Oculatellaceae cyanobacterium Prado106]